MSILESTLFQNSILAGILISVATGIIGTFVVTQKKVSIAGGIAHASYGGLGIALFLAISPIWGAMGFAILTAILIAAIIRQPGKRVDTLIGIIWSLGMAIGIIFVDLTKGYAVDLMSFLFGSIVAISAADLYMLVVANAIIAIVVLILFKDFLAYFFDPEFCLIMNRKNRILDYIFLILTALSIVVMIRLVGLILVIALLSISPTIAEFFTSRLKNIIKLSIVFNIFFITLGLFLSYYLNLTAGALIVLIAAIFYLLINFVWRLKKS